MSDNEIWDEQGNWKGSAETAKGSGEKSPVEGTAAVAERGPETMKVIDGGRITPQMTEETKRLKENFRFFGPATALYALFYVFCTYKNDAGITYPFFVAGSFLFFFYSLKKLGLTLKKDSIFYAASMMLLAISTFCTDDERIIILNRLAIFLLMISFLLTQFFRTGKWGLGKYFRSIMKLIFTSFGDLPRPVIDMVGYARNTESKKTKKALYVLLGFLITLPVFAIVATLLSSADALFRKVMDDMLLAVNPGDVISVCFRILCWFFGTYMLLSRLCRRTISEDVQDCRKGEPILAITLTGMLSLMYVPFSVIQILGLFLGKLTLPEGYTYAEYAREGFFQLLAVAILNLVIVLLCMALFRESKILKGVLTIMSLCTFIMIASSAMRMLLYVETYNLTFLRIFVLWALAVLFLLFLGVVIQIYKESFPLFRYGMTVVTVFYIGLAFSHPDYVIAKFNLENSGASLDYSYLAELSSDAAPVLIPYLKEHGYDLSVVTIANASAKDDRIADTLRPKASQDAYWPKVKSILDGKSAKRNDVNGFGYYYLENVRADYWNGGIRNFNLSRYRAVQEATK